VRWLGHWWLFWGASLAFNSFLIDQQFPNKILAFKMRTHVESKSAFSLFILNLFLAGVGCVLNIFFSSGHLWCLLCSGLPRAMASYWCLLASFFSTNLQIGYSPAADRDGPSHCQPEIEKSVLYL